MFKSASEERLESDNGRHGEAVSSFLSDWAGNKKVVNFQLIPGLKYCGKNLANFQLIPDIKYWDKKQKENLTSHLAAVVSDPPPPD